ncbi:endo-beta-N-acetylglucosaminidase [Luteipulveratus mongoliensis]|uniref:Cytosolic endo-beta-N-acetylglucosaminidase TIM barrel domain-containing protein n=1 Tax=Luteipulveratus mongoliensis TaxID=571913 RepID=A0A0K1JIR4_9MICO|nr:hypothetical protein [Luteipulveratus mongoliensis]AKU16470.1 hypothetical protein VV02_12320 [Luteipulveratus mongoliensis]
MSNGMDHDGRRPAPSRRTVLRFAAASAAATTAPGLHIARATAATPDPGYPTDHTQVVQRIPPGPSTFGYISGDLLAFDPKTDPSARYFRGRVPLAPRIPTFRPTQAHPDLDPGTQLLTLDGDYRGSSADLRARAYGDESFVYTHRYWSYLDYWASWHGQILKRFTQEDVIASQQDGGPPLKYGVVEIPNPAWIAHGHRNGVKVLGCWFWPRGDADQFAALVQQRADGSFPVADKLIEIRQFFGYDGMFINQEGEPSAGQPSPYSDAELAARLKEFVRYLKAKDPDYYLCWYDSFNAKTGKVEYRNRVDEVNAVWLGTPQETLVDSIWMNYDWPRADSDLAISRRTAVKAGFDPLQTVFATTEAQQGGFNPRERFSDLANTTTTAPTSWALFVPNEMWNSEFNNDVTFTPKGRAHARRWEQQYWVGPKGNPALSGKTSATQPAGRTDIHNPAHWDGVAHTIVEKSVVGSLPFSSNFDIGVGPSFTIGGQQMSDRPWNNIGCADVLPTWQYWNIDRRGASSSVTLDETRVWEGAASIRVQGSTGNAGSVELRLYKTALPARHGLDVSFVVRPDHPGYQYDIGITYADDPRLTIWSALEPTRTTHGWVTVHGRVPAADRTVAAVAMRVRAPRVASFGLNLGNLTLIASDTPPQRPDRPTGFRVTHLARVDDRVEAAFAWDDDPSVRAYDVLQEVGPSWKWLGRVDSDALFALDTFPSTGAHRRFQLVPIGAVYQRGPATTATATVQP